ncbi:DMT family transporter [Desulfosarcina widdelii]|uniref:DMT family transporter n=1 Tax=Desulfosarcina widdelii TaxID=947919 RepID=UPI001E4C19EE|nr:DMT family transporter [Desulfosarcina widdelii]
MKNVHGTLKFASAGLVSAFLFGAATPASKFLIHDIQPQSLAGLLYLGAAVGVFPVAMRKGSIRWPWHAGRRTIWLLTGAIVLGGVLGPLLLLMALQFANAGSVSLWLNLEFVATLMLGHFLFREHLTLRGWIAAGGTVIAALLLVGGNEGGGVIPALLIVCGCICWGFDNHFTALIDGIPPTQTTFWKGVVAGSVNLMAGIAIDGGPNLPVSIFVALLVGVFSYGISITLYVMAAQGLGAIRSQMIFSTAPFFGLLLSVTVLGEAFTSGQAIAAGLMAASLMILFSEKHVHFHRHNAMSHQHAHRHDGLHHDHHHEGLASTVSHSHWHEHKPIAHNHKHWPDLHHRHDHEESDV